MAGSSRERRHEEQEEGVCRRSPRPNVKALPSLRWSCVWPRSPLLAQTIPGGQIIGVGGQEEQGRANKQEALASAKLCPPRPDAACRFLSSRARLSAS